ncbi:MAG: MtrB/PioB family outer membrane beta-barrel protein, partial [Candidatus Margulisiibacteriota bacterium]
MNHKNLFAFSLLAASILFSRTFAIAEEGDNPVLRDKISLIVRSVDFERQSAKFEEYGKIPYGFPAEITLNRSNKSYSLYFNAEGVAENNQYYDLKLTKHGSYKIELASNQIPHQFVYDGKTFYSGIGTGNLTVPPAMQKDLQGSTSSGNAASKLINTYLPGAYSKDISLTRKRAEVNLDVFSMEPLDLKVQVTNEKREGTRPWSGSFGFGNAIELPEPVDYDTTGMKLSAEYAPRKNIYVNANYSMSTFKNNIDTLTFDNPFRSADSTAATAYAANYAAGPSKGLIDLYPDNRYNSLSLNWAFTDLPMGSRISATTSKGWMYQNDALVPYTTNTAIKTGAVSGVAGKTVPFNAYDPANLPQTNVDAKVETQLINLAFV